MPFSVEQLPILAVWSASLCAAALVLGLLALIVTTRTARPGGSTPGSVRRSTSASACSTPPFTTKGEGGTGLGLDICKHVVEGMGGTVFVDPEAANTTIRIRLPAA